MLSALHNGVKHVVRVAPCSSGFSSIDYVTILDDLLDCLDFNNFRPSALCFDAAKPVVKGLHISRLQVKTQQAETWKQSKMKTRLVCALQCK